MEFPLPSFPFLLTLLIFLFTALKIAKKSKTNNLVPNLPPGPWKLPLIGNVHQMIGSLPHHHLRNLANRYGPLMHLRLGELSVIVISSAETAKEMMKTHDIIFASRPFLLIVSIVSYNSKNMSFAPYGDYWRQLRKICTLEVFSAKRVKLFRPLRVEEFSNLIESICAHAGMPVNLSKMILSSTSAIISRAAFGKKYQDHEEFISLVEEAMHLAGGFNVADLFPSNKLLVLITGMRHKIEKIHFKIDRILENIIAEHKEKKETRNYTGDVEGNEDLVDVLLQVQENGDLEFPCTIDNIKAVILDIFIGGSETSSTIVEWAMSELLKDPKRMEKAQADVRNVFGKKGYVDEEGLDQLTYLNLVIKETMRLHPPLPLSVPRECREKCQINGYEVPVKSKVIVNLWAISRDSKHWTNAEDFNPERFLGSSVDYKGNHYHYIPFGAGRRMCPGMTFGLANVDLPLAQLLYHFDWKLADGKKNEDFDMTEASGASVRRKNDLYVIPIPYHPSPDE